MVERGDSPINKDVRREACRDDVRREAYGASCGGARAAERVARRRFLLRAHTAERNTRPPSSGKPGSMLNTASEALMKPRYPQMPATPSLTG